MRTAPMIIPEMCHSRRLPKICCSKNGRSPSGANRLSTLISSPKNFYKSFLILISPGNDNNRGLLGQPAVLFVSTFNFTISKMRENVIDFAVFFYCFYILDVFLFPTSSLNRGHFKSSTDQKTEKSSDEKFDPQHGFRYHIVKTKSSRPIVGIYLPDKN